MKKPLNNDDLIKILDKLKINSLPGNVYNFIEESKLYQEIFYMENNIDSDLIFKLKTTSRIIKFVSDFNFEDLKYLLKDADLTKYRLSVSVELVDNKDNKIMTKIEIPIQDLMYYTPTVNYSEIILARIVKTNISNTVSELIKNINNGN